MRKIKTFLLLTVVAVGLLPLSSVQAKDKGDTSASLQRKYDRRYAEMKPLDKNQDGLLQVSELQQKPKRDFKAADADNNKILSKQELQDVLDAFSSETYGSEYFAERYAKKLANRYRNADKNHDKALSWAEYNKYFTKRRSKFDRDEDGIVTAKEYRTDVERLPRRYR